MYVNQNAVPWENAIQVVFVLTYIYSYHVFYMNEWIFLRITFGRSQDAGQSSDLSHSIFILLIWMGSRRFLFVARIPAAPRESAWALNTPRVGRTLKRRCIPPVSSDHDLSKPLQKVLFLTVLCHPNLHRLKAVYVNLGNCGKLLLPYTCVI